MRIEQTIDNISQWARVRNLIKGSAPQAQMNKLIEEVGKLSSDIAKGKDVRDSIGGCLVVLNIISIQSNTTLSECSNIAYNDIKNRNGKMINGVFVKESDL